MYGGMSDRKYSEQSIWSMECISDNAVAVYDSGLHYWTCGGSARLLPYLTEALEIINIYKNIYNKR